MKHYYFKGVISVADARPIGIFDSGLGGLTVVKEIIKLMPSENIVYFGDTGRVPYGTRSNETIKRYAKEDEEFLLSRSVKMVVAACGTVSSVASDMGKKLPVPYFEVVSPAAKEAVKSTKNKKIGILGTNATIASGEHKRQILELLPDAQVYTAGCTLFVPLVEEGWYKSDDVVVKTTVQRYLEDIKKAGVDTLILGCTHYPILKEVIGEYMGEGVTLINAGVSTAKSVKEYLTENDMLNESNEEGKREFYVSDKVGSFCKTASLLLGVEVDEEKATQVNIGNL